MYMWEYRTTVRPRGRLKQAHLKITSTIKHIHSHITITQDSADHCYGGPTEIDTHIVEIPLGYPITLHSIYIIYPK